tara:strand:+ start:10 stop:486 length:477 start_codon:yes stop_codon:yes gene_type:complete
MGLNEKFFKSAAGGGDYFNTVLYTGDGGTKGVTGVGFTPDLVWVKCKSRSGDPHEIADIVRGVDNTLNSNSSNAQYYNTTYQFNSFNLDGFTVTDNTAGDLAVNGTGLGYVAWCFKAGGNSNTFNVDGTGYSSASAAGLATGTDTPTGASVNTAGVFL